MVNKTSDILNLKFLNEESLENAKALLNKDEQSEEAFLGAQAVLMLHGLL